MAGVCAVPMRSYAVDSPELHLLRRLLRRADAAPAQSSARDQSSALVQYSAPAQYFALAQERRSPDPGRQIIVRKMPVYGRIAVVLS